MADTPDWREIGFMADSGLNTGQMTFISGRQSGGKSLIMDVIKESYETLTPGGEWATPYTYVAPPGSVAPDWPAIIAEVRKFVKEERERRPRLILNPHQAAEYRKAFGTDVDIVESRYLPKDTAYLYSPKGALS